MLDQDGFDDDDLPPLREAITPSPKRPMPDDRFLYGIFGKMAELAAQHTEADPVAHIATLYSYTGTMAGREYSVFGQPTACWPLLIGDSSYGRKGTAKNDIMRFFDRIEDRSLLPRVTSSAVSESGIVREVRDKSEKTDKTTGMPTDKGIEEKRLWVYLSEFGKMLHAFKTPGLNAQEVLCSLYDGEDQRISTAKEVITATRQAVSLYGSMTGEMLADRFDPGALSGGILTRLMPVFVDRVTLYRGLEFPEEWKVECAALGLDLATRIDCMRRAVGKNSGKTKEITFDRDVTRWWRKEGHEYLTTDPSNLSGFARMWSGRRAGNFQRLTGILALSDETDEVNMGHVHPALSFVDYAMDSLGCIEPEFGVAPVATARTAPMSPKARKWYAYMLQAHDAGRTFVPRKEVSIDVFKKNLNSEAIDKLESDVPNLSYYMDKFPGNPTPTRCYYLADRVSH
jgi:hypothetical protein